ncbi:phenylalanine 4-monooxygenase [Streptomyces sp. NPDC053560]|uniref:phenylalanine 4-monooxygenase n=1 Tax=Streptomyces sp. NPDC053560 TaxID=3365711 RepID=UPI0037D06FA6
MIDLMARTPVSHDGRLGRAEEHPGHADRPYVRRRDRIAALATGHRVGAPSPLVEYTAEEHATWRTVLAALADAQRGRVCRAVAAARERAPVPADHIPQHAEVGDRLHELTGFRFTLAGGIVPNARFLGSMADGYFHAVQYVRHPAMPLYTFEPDVLHDMLGHGTHLCDPWFAELYRTVGRAAARVTSDDALDLISRVYWYTLEYGVVHEGGRPKAYGAALLSSYGELRRFDRADIRAWDLADIAARPYQVAGYQPVLYTVESLDHLAETLHGFLDDFDESTRDRLGLPPLAQRGFMGRPAPERAAAPAAPPNK